ncbi:hypothetical protein [Actinomycetospora corticicola]|uniref:hypothetical protein n=1 Tax=Actinomycetospora corticicola TaxID=663602 RepID=UPI001C544EB1|nr:hypothetical protein [Actinomycetospora corticicola]
MEEAFGPNGLHEIPPPIRRHPRIAFAVLGGFVLSAVILLATLAMPGTMTVQGAFTAHGSAPLASGAECWSGLYAPGTPVTVVDGRGALVATGRLDSGQVTTDSTSAYGRYGYATDCTFSFTVSGVPTGEDAYGIRIGSMRNTVVFSEAEMADSPAIETTN